MHPQNINIIDKLSREVEELSKRVAVAANAEQDERLKLDTEIIAVTGKLLLEWERQSHALEIAGSYKKVFFAIFSLVAIIAALVAIPGLAVLFIFPNLYNFLFLANVAIATIDLIISLANVTATLGLAISIVASFSTFAVAIASSENERIMKNDLQKLSDIFKKFRHLEAANRVLHVEEVMENSVTTDKMLTLNFASQSLGPVVCRYLKDKLEDFLRDKLPDGGSINLNLQHCDITDEGVKMLIDMLKNNPKLKENKIQIDLVGNEISEEMGKELGRQGVICRIRLQDGEIAVYGGNFVDGAPTTVERPASSSTGIILQKTKTQSPQKSLPSTTDEDRIFRELAEVTARMEQEQTHPPAPRPAS